MSNNSVTTAASALSSTSITPCIVSRCGEFSIPLVRAGLDEGGNSNWRSFIPQGFITLSHAQKLYGCGMSLQRLRYILTALDVENQSIHILKVDSGQKALIDAYEEKYANIPEYWRLSGPLAEYLLSFERCPFHTETPDHYALVSYLIDLSVSQSSALMPLHSMAGYRSA